MFIIILIHFFHFTLLCSYSRYGLEDLEKDLQESDFLPIFEKNKRESLVELMIPKFKIESKINLKNILSNLGMEKMFQPSTTGLKGISDEALFVSDVIQKAFIEVDETGTEAAAATAVIVVKRTGFFRKIDRFVADHPFLFFIRDLQTNLVLFQGRVTKPSVREDIF